MSKISAIRYVGREIRGIKSAMQAGTRCARINKKTISTGIALGAKQVYKKVGPLPIATGVAAAVAVPAPGACTAGILLGSLISKPIKSLLKIIRK